MIAVIAAFTLCFGMLQGSSAEKNVRIVNGSTLSLSEGSFQVAILRNGELYCGGSIISEWHVLTAAQCLQNPAADGTLLVRSGSNSPYCGGVVSSVASIFLHVGYKFPSRDYNVAVLLLGEELQFNTYTQPIMLNFLELTGKPAAVIGYGKSSAGGPDTSGLQMAVVELAEGKVCQPDTSITPFQMCAIDKSKSICNGDSGGPLVTNVKPNLVQIGIVSFGSDTNCSSSVIFAKVAAFRDFIDWATHYSVTWNYNISQ